MSLLVRGGEGQPIRNRGAEVIETDKKKRVVHIHLNQENHVSSPDSPDLSRRGGDV